MKETLPDFEPHRDSRNEPGKPPHDPLTSILNELYNVQNRLTRYANNLEGFARWLKSQDDDGDLKPAIELCQHEASFCRSIADGSELAYIIKRIERPYS